MFKTINSRIIGILQQDESLSDWWKSHVIEIPFFDNQKLPITFINFESEQDKDFIDEADITLNNFFLLTQTDKYKISDLVYKNCMEFLADSGKTDEKLEHIKDKNEIWQFIYPTDIYVKRGYKDQAIYVQIACECEWDIENGLQFIYKKGNKLTRISEQDGLLYD